MKKIIIVTIILFFFNCQKKKEQNKTKCNQTYENKKNVIIACLDLKSDYLVIKNNMENNIKINMYKFHSPYYYLYKKDINNNKKRLISIPISLPPSNINEFDSIIKPNHKISIHLKNLSNYKTIIDGEKYKACIYYKIEGKKKNNQICSEWETYQKKD